MTARRRRSLHTLAFYAQAGRCFYCGLPMWLTAPAELGLKAGNVVAAHSRCNQGRHQRKGPAPSAEAFRTLVQKRLAIGRWWSRLPPGIARASV